MASNTYNLSLESGFNELIRDGLIPSPKDNQVVVNILKFFDSDSSGISFSKTDNNKFLYEIDQKKIIVEAFFNDNFALDGVFSNSNMNGTLNDEIVGYITSIQFQFDNNVYRYDTSYPIHFGTTIPNNNGWIIQKLEGYYDIHFGIYEDFNENGIERSLELRHCDLTEILEYDSINNIITRQQMDGLLLTGL